MDTKNMISEFFQKAANHKFDFFLPSIILMSYGALFTRYKSTMGDFGDFVKAGDLIYKNIDPYSNLMYVNSPVSATMLFITSKIFPFIFFPLFWQILNVLGIYFFSKEIFKRDSGRYVLISMFLFALTNVARALIGNVQVTGLVLGLMAYAVKLERHKNSDFLVILPAWIALELKPQFALGFCLFLLFHRGIHWRRFVSIISLTGFSHLYVEYIFKGDLHFLWIRKIFSYSSTSLGSGYEISFWKSFSSIFGETDEFRLFSLILLITHLLLLVYFAFIGNKKWAIFFAVFLPLQYSYLHLYDLAFIAIALIMSAFRFKKFQHILGIAILIQIFPIELSFQVFSLCIITFVLVCIFLKIWNTKIVFIIWTGILSFYIMSIAFSKNLDQELQMANFISLPIVVITILNRNFLADLFQSKPQTSPGT